MSQVLKVRVCRGCRELFVSPSATSEPFNCRVCVKKC